MRAERKNSYGPLTITRTLSTSACVQPPRHFLNSCNHVPRVFSVHIGKREDLGRRGWNSKKCFSDVRHNCELRISSSQNVWNIPLRRPDERQKGRNSCLRLRSRSVFGSFGVKLMSCKVIFHVVRSAFQNSVWNIPPFSPTLPKQLS